MTDLLRSKKQLFIDTYLKNGGNATQAYKVVYPNAKTSTCRSNSSKWMNDPQIKKAISKAKYKASMRSQITVESQLKRLDAIISTSEGSDEAKDKSVAITAIKEQNTLLGLYEINHFNNLNPESIDMYDLHRLSEDELKILQKLLHKAYIGDKGKQYELAE